MSNIEWTQKTPNPIVGCSKISPGCENCYAIRMAWRLMHSPHPAVAKKYAGLVKKTNAGNLNWTGKINFDPRAMRKVISNKTPTLYFVNSMGDLFHPNVPFDKIDLVFAAMGIASWHTFQILTKHTDRMLQWFNHKDTAWKNEGMQGNERIRFQTYHEYGESISIENWKWPLPNVMLGTSIENQEQADYRIPFLLQAPAKIRFLSCEPLLGKLNLTPYLFNMLEKCPDHGIVKGIARGYGDEYEYSECPECEEIVEAIIEDIDWVIVGGESGPGARPMHPDWARSIRDQCKTADIPFFFKQWGQFTPYTSDFNQPDIWISIEGKQSDTDLNAITEGGAWQAMYQVGKKWAGRELDGEFYNEMPRIALSAYPP